MPVKQPVQVQIEYKNFPFQLKAVNEDEGIIEGYLSTFGNVDQGKDRVIKGAFKKTLMDAKSRMEHKGKQCLLPVLWMHVPEQPLGKCLEASEDDHGLYVKFWLDITTNGQGIPNNPLATMVFSGYKNGYIDEQSMGYKAIQKEYDGQGVRNLKEVQLWELSCVTTLFAANDLAQVTSVKSKDKAMPDKPERKDFNDRYRQQCIEDWFYSDFSNLTQALKGAIIDMFMVGDTPQADTLSTILNSSEENKIGFIQALEQYVQKGIDLDVSNYLSDPSNPDARYYANYGYMSKRNDLDTKAGAVVSQSNADRMQGHVNTLMQVKDAIHTVAEDITRYITGNDAYVSDAGTKTTAILEPFFQTLKQANQPPTSTDEGLEQFSNWLQSQIGRGPNDAA